MMLLNLMEKVRQTIKSVIERLAGEPASLPIPQADVAFHQLGAKKEITDKQINVDAAAIGLILKSAGYNPLQALALVSKIYGGVTGCLTKSIVVNGVPYTAGDIQNQFFARCNDERLFVKSEIDKITKEMIEQQGHTRMH